MARIALLIEDKLLQKGPSSQSLHLLSAHITHQRDALQDNTYVKGFIYSPRVLTIWA